MPPTNSKQHEYTYLINLYTDLVGFPIVISTFKYLSNEDITKLISAADILQTTFQQILPKLADKEL
jgi:hypothetical protein